MPIISYCPICGAQRNVTHGDQAFICEKCQDCMDAEEETPLPSNELCDDCKAKLEDIETQKEPKS